MVRRVWCLAALSIVCGACGDEADPVTVRGRISALVPSLGNGAVEAVEMARNAPAMEWFRQWLDRERPPAETEPVGDSLATWLNEHVFVDAAYEGDGIYRVTGAELPLRVRAELAGDEGLNLTLLLDEGRRALLSVELRSDSVKVALDVGELAGWPGVQQAEGRVSARLSRAWRPEAWTLLLAVDEAVRFVAEGGTDIQLEERKPAFSATVTVGTGTLSVAANAGAVRVRWPWEASVVDLDLAGFVGTVQVGLDVWALGLGFGPRTSRLALDGQTLIALDFNPDASRRVDLAFDQDDEIDTLFLAPRLDFSLTAGLAPLLARGMTVDAWLLDEVYDFRLGTVLGFVDGGVRVIGEPLSILAQKSGTGVTAPTGTCLVPDEVTAGEQALIGAVAVEECP